QRARARLRVSFPDGPPRGPLALDAGERALLDRYVETWEAGDIRGFVALLARDAAWAMPPWREWYAGPEAISAFLSWAWRRPGRGRRLIPTSANGQPAFGYYRRREGGTWYEPFAIQVVEMAPMEVHSITNFVDARLFPLLGLPSSLPSNER
ncbi:MAG TPA: nuclear transport factor 2 family protein, partial [Candidatus Deferrimicrobium sp.]|nr:nuclear transport factor 2 family protein [Candidatus Deferrimicrobium sp.]